MAEAEVPGPEQPLGNDFAVMTKRASVIILSRPAGVDVGLDLNPPGFGLMAQLKFVEDRCVRNETAFPTDQCPLEMYRTQQAHLREPEASGITRRSGRGATEI